MLFKSTTALVTAGFLFGASAIAAQTQDDAQLIDQLPKEGPVVVVGVVAEIDNKQEFTLRDSAGNTVDIDSSTELDIKQGDRVKVIGNIDDKVMGMGTEIDASSVTKLDASENGLSLSGDAKGEAKGEVRPQINAMVQTSEPSDDAKTINSLPESGMVTVKGTVSSVNEAENRFILTDSNGETIDVHTIAKLEVVAGQEVEVTGRMNAEVAGIGQEIVSARVKVLS